MMKASELISHRLSNQQLVSTRFSSVKEVVSWMGCIQAQDYAMAKWAIGLRLPETFTEQSIEAAINAGQIVRLHTMRPTWHFVSCDDARWITELTSPNIKKLMASQNRQLGLGDTIFKKSNRLIGRFLADGTPRTREEIALHLKSKGIVLNNLAATNVMIVAELDGIVCNGPRRDKQFTYVLSDKVISHSSYPKNESIYRLAKTYFTSHGPATLSDFMWWSGLSKEDALNGIAECGKDIRELRTKNNTFWAFSDAPSIAGAGKNFLLPCYDEFTVGYADRTFLGGDADREFFGHFIFRPLVIYNGKAAGIWSRTIKKHLELTVRLKDENIKFSKLNLRKIALRFQRFVGATDLSIKQI